MADEKQSVGFYDCAFGAHQIWDMKPNANGQVALHLAGLSLGAAETELCLSLAELPGGSLQAAGGRYTNSTELRACDGGASQSWNRTVSGQLAIRVGEELGCLDCANCQKDISKAWVYTPCYPHGSEPSNEAFDYDTSIKNVADQEFHKCLGVCTPPQTLLV